MFYHTEAFRMSQGDPLRLSSFFLNVFLHYLKALEDISSVIELNILKSFFLLSLDVVHFPSLENCVKELHGFCEYFLD